MEIFRNHVMRLMTGCKLQDKIRINDLRKMTNLTPLESLIRSKTLTLFGHIKRSRKGLLKICLEGMIPGKKTRGRPRNRWRDNVIKWTELPDWFTVNSTCNNRNVWKSISCIDAQSAILRKGEI